MIRALVTLGLLLAVAVCADQAFNGGELTKTALYLLCPRSRCGLII